jgi:hypothetical protein
MRGRGGTAASGSDAGVTMGIETENVSKALEAWVLNRRGSEHNRGDADLYSAIGYYTRSSESDVDGGGAVLAKLVWPKVYGYLFKNEDSSDLEFSLLVGLLITGGWRILFENADVAREFVAVVIDYIEKNADLHTLYADAVAQKLKVAMSEWIAPGAAIGPHSLQPIASALFGEPWYAVVYGACDENGTLAAVISATQPDFLPGRISDDIEHGAMALPGMLA